MRYKVALLIETSNSYARGLLHGIRSYIRTHADWVIYLCEQRRGEDAPSWLRKWQGHGIIARLETKQIATAVLESGLPVVDVSAAQWVPGIPYVETDDKMFAITAADHLLGRGLKNFAFCGESRFMWSTNRGRHFSEYLKSLGYPCHLDESPLKPRTRLAEERHLIEWLKQLPKPVGIMACYDIRGREVLDACREAEIPVPDEAAVIGVDDDELICDLAEPPLSSVIPNAHRIGYEAAQLLGRMMAGEQVEPGPHLIPPLGVATRHSTDLLAVEDPIVAQALRFIRENALKGIKVTDVVEHVQVSRRVLETRVKECVRRTPHEEILRIQIEQVKQLLTQTELTLEKIADRCGFRHAEYMSFAFKRATGQSPGKYRPPKS